MFLTHLIKQTNGNNSAITKWLHFDDPKLASFGRSPIETIASINDNKSTCPCFFGEGAVGREKL